ncbi:hypothetical protein CAPTEDRAFT_197409 [Capitella teleta]|uniref:Uncharacterized protein n=1 Tax=Capitella teleta TaxID=283909 RepID=R7VMB3_CAPTE|nr:hypothetical protein CAPTEDRAFT_197409 [Capitella teleta]|eukprot:ELU18540.1 hypothetical protein CAPTEDRAFT_197409 [Capitella teleta]
MLIVNTFTAKAFSGRYPYTATYFTQKALTLPLCNFYMNARNTVIIVAILGFMGNKKTVTHTMMLSIAISDLMTCLVCVPTAPLGVSVSPLFTAGCLIKFNFEILEDFIALFSIHDYCQFDLSISQFQVYFLIVDSNRQRLNPQDPLRVSHNRFPSFGISMKCCGESFTLNECVASLTVSYDLFTRSFIIAIITLFLKLDQFFINGCKPSGQRKQIQLFRRTWGDIPEVDGIQLN